MRRLALGLAALLALAGGIAPGQEARPSAPLVLDFVDVGQGDACLIRSPEGKTALVDAGPSKDIVPKLRGLGVTSLDLVAVSHHHVDHYGGMDDVIRAFRPRVFLSADSPHSTSNYLRLLELVRANGMQAIFPTDRPRKLELGSVILTILPQPPTDREEENENSIGIRVQYGAFSALLTGDSEGQARRFWEATCPELIGRCQVLKLAHHGSRNGTDARWLRFVRPELAVASLGRGNSFGHPHPETLALLEGRGIPLLRTDEAGTVEVRSDGRTWQVAERGPVARGPPRRPRVPAGGGAGPAEVAPGLVDLNTATERELIAIKGIGRVLAGRIIAGRPYRSVEDLLGVRGIGEKRLAEIRPFVTVGTR